MTFSQYFQVFSTLFLVNMRWLNLQVILKLQFGTIWKNTDLSVIYIRVLLLLFWTWLSFDLEIWTRLWIYIHFVFLLLLWSQHPLFDRLPVQIDWVVSVWFGRFERSEYFLPYICYIYSIYLFIYFMLSLLLPFDIINFIASCCCWAYFIISLYVGRIFDGLAECKKGMKRLLKKLFCYFARNHLGP